MQKKSPDEKQESPDRKQDQIERRRLQNRLSQRNHRRKVRDRMARLQELVVANELRAVATLNRWHQPASIDPSHAVSPPSICVSCNNSINRGHILPPSPCEPSLPLPTPNCGNETYSSPPTSPTLFNTTDCHPSISNRMGVDLSFGIPDTDIGTCLQSPLFSRDDFQPQYRLTGPNGLSESPEFLTSGPSPENLPPETDYLHPKHTSTVPCSTPFTSQQSSGSSSPDSGEILESLDVGNLQCLCHVQVPAPMSPDMVSGNWMGLGTYACPLHTLPLFNFPVMMG